mmetsp:Transcript_39337/g.70835  ORF Transcript_39337/g.70835 Transcript_39337/m.70835 type:complete len:356 (+) Transcript_39337:177-1244(+)
MGDGTNRTSSSADGNAAATTKQRPRLLDDTSLKSHLSSVRAVKSGDDQKPSASDVTTKEEDEHQHVLVLASNKHLVSLGHETHRAHLELCRQYHPFPELEKLLTETFQYRAAIEIIQNEMNVTKSNEELNEILTSNQIITISVAGSTISGRRLTDDELKAVNATCLYLDQLKSTQTELTTFVESRMERWAPSVCALIGPSLAAQLLASTGGLAELTRIPACKLATNGLASSMVFTPVQGLELVNPDANGERVRHRRIPSGFPRMLDFNLLFQKSSHIIFIYMLPVTFLPVRYPVVGSSQDIPSGRCRICLAFDLHIPIGWTLKNNKDLSLCFLTTSLGSSMSTQEVIKGNCLDTR